VAKSTRSDKSAQLKKPPSRKAPLGKALPKSPVVNDENHRMHLSHLESVLDLMGKHEIAELEWENKGERLKLKTRHANPYAPVFETAPGYPPQGWTQSRLPGAASTLSSAGFGGVSHAGAVGLNASQALGGAPVAGLPVSQVSPVSPVSNEKQVLSPFVGTFYRSPSPASDPYAREGQVIKRGDVLCIIEAMKLMNEIDAEFPGKIKSVLVENGQPVEFGEPLFLIEI